MTSSDEVFRLVHALSMSEKRYFRLFAGLQTRKKDLNYLRLFDALLAQEEYDAKALAAQFAGDLLGKNISAQKNHLKSLIFKAMRAYHSGKTVDIKIREWISDVDFLVRKDLPEIAIKRLKTARKLAESHDRLLPFLEIMDKERLLIKAVKKKGLEGILNQMLQEKNMILDHLRTEYVLADIYNRLFLIQAGEFVVRSKQKHQIIQEIQQHPLVDALPAGSSFQAQHLRLQVRGIAAQLLGDLPGMHTAFHDSMRLWQAHPLQIQESPEKFLKIQANYLNACFVLEKYDEVPVVLSDLRGRQFSTRELGTLAGRYMHYYQFMYHLSQEKFLLATALVPGIEEFIAQNRSRIPVTWEYPLYYNIGVAYFFQEAFSKANRFFNRILDARDSDLRNEIRIASRILLLIGWMEQDDWDLIAYKLRSTKERLEKEAGKLVFERAVMEMIEGVLKDPANQTSLLVQLSDQLENLSQETNEGRAIGFQEVHAWVKSRLSGEPLA